MITEHPDRLPGGGLAAQQDEQEISGRAGQRGIAAVGKPGSAESTTAASAAVLASISA